MFSRKQWVPGASAEPGTRNRLLPSISGACQVGRLPCGDPRAQIEDEAIKIHATALQHEGVMCVTSAGSSPLGVCLEGTVRAFNVMWESIVCYK